MPAHLTVFGLPGGSFASDGVAGGSCLGYNTPTLNTAAEQLGAHHRRAAQAAQADADVQPEPQGAPMLSSPGAAAPPAALPRPPKRANEPAAGKKAADPPRQVARRGAAAPLLRSSPPHRICHAGEEALFALAQHSGAAASLAASSTKEAVRGLRRALNIGGGRGVGTQQGRHAQGPPAAEGAYASWCAR